MTKTSKPIVATTEQLWLTDAYALLRLCRHFLARPEPMPQAEREALRTEVNEACAGFEDLMRRAGRTREEE